MLIIALVLAVVSLAALVTAVVTSNEVIAWVCIGLSALGMSAAHRRCDPRPQPAAGGRRLGPDGGPAPVAPRPVSAGSVSTGSMSADPPTPTMPTPDADAYDAEVADYPDTDDESIPGTLDEQIRVEDHPDEILYDEPDDDTPSDDEPVYPPAAEEAAIHIVTEDEDALTVTEDEDAIADAIDYSESSAEPYPDDSATVVVYAGEPYPDEAATVISADEPEEDGSGESDVVMSDDGSTTVVYADETDDSVSGSPDERGESDAR